MFGYDNSVSISQIYKSTRLWNRYNLASFIVRNAAHTVPFWRPLAYRYLYPQYFEKFNPFLWFKIDIVYHSMVWVDLE
jgi:hypothetical protein